VTNSNIGLHRFAIFLTCCTFGLIFAGGMVTSTDSGLSVPDWPLSYGQLFPPMVGGVLYEHSHRLFAASVGILTIILAVWLWKRETRNWVRRLGGLAVLAVICQGLLGGITVLFLLPTAISVSHAGLAQLFMCLMLSVAIFTSPKWPEIQRKHESVGSPSLRTLTILTTVAVYIQILIGALVRHTASGLAIPDFPLSFGRLIPPAFTGQILVHFTHRIGALVVTVLIAWVALRIFRQYATQEALLHPSYILLTTLVFQISLGAITIWSSKAPIPTTMHVVGGSFVLASSLYLTLRTHQVLMPAAASPKITTAPAAAVTE
jgi:cytochrome c oxidase assembly protein subunit 15